MLEEVRRKVERIPWSLVLAGPPACGKGELVERLCKRLHLVHISSGITPTHALPLTHAPSA